MGGWKWAGGLGGLQKAHPEAHKWMAAQRQEVVQQTHKEQTDKPGLTLSVAPIQIALSVAVSSQEL